jgi:hypothetical protein
MNGSTLRVKPPHPSDSEMAAQERGDAATAWFFVALTETARAFHSPLSTPISISIAEYVGAVAQLGERDVRNVEVRGSIPLGSTIFLLGFRTN